MANTMLGGLGAALGTNSTASTATPQVNSNAFQYGAGGLNGNVSGTGQETQYQLQGATAQGRQGAQVQNQYNGRDQAATQGVMSQYGGLGSYYQGVLNGSQPSLAQAQMNAATDQNIRAQMAMARSAPGGLAGAAAMMGAQQQGVQMQQNAAQQSMIGRIQ